MSKGNVFLTSDTHFTHRGIVQFEGVNGTKLRPWTNTNEMDEALVKNWNSVVKPEDKIYHLGDVVINRGALKILSRLNGTKVLIKGNHDLFKPEEYLEYFKDIRGSHKLGSFILTHIPIHPDSLARWTDGCIHGHLHDGRVKLPNKQIDKRYICVSVEHTNFTPIPFEEIEKYR
jgi:calcineurin-like phosphoesterase family protein